MLKVRENITWRVLDGEAVILNTDSGHYYTLNGIATEIWEQIVGEHSDDEIVAYLGQRYETEDEGTIREDLHTQVQYWFDEGLLYEVESS